MHNKHERNKRYTKNVQQHFKKINNLARRQNKTDENNVAAHYTTALKVITTFKNKRQRTCTSNNDANPVNEYLAGTMGAFLHLNSTYVHYIPYDEVLEMKRRGLQ